MNHLEKVYSIVYACDNNFIPLLAASIKSLEVNSPGSVKQIFIISDGITERNWQKLTESVSTDEIVLKKIPHTELLSKDVKIPYFNNSLLPITVFFRVFIEAFLPSSTERILYLDADTIVLGDVSVLFETDLGEFILGAVQDLSIKTFDCPWGGVRNHDALGLSGSTNYFNSGVLLIDFNRWKKFEVFKKVMNVANEHKKYILYADQYCLNVVLVDSWKALDPLWNHPVDYCLIDPEYAPQPFILHFTGIKPIYSNYNYSEEYRRIFRYYLNLTKWKDFPLKGKLEQKIITIRRVLRKLLG